MITVPAIDLLPARHGSSRDRRRVAEQIDQACRVVNPPPGNGPSRPRLSMAFFNHPNYDVLIECLAPPGKAKHEPILSGEYRDLKYAKTGLAPLPTRESVEGAARPLSQEVYR